MAEAVKVVVRCRPMSKTELGRGCFSIINVNEEVGSVSIAQPSNAEDTKSFTFDASFGQDSQQKPVYEELGE